MWVMTTIGFFSIVEKAGDRQSGKLTIRARARSDLENLRALYLPNMDTIAENAGTDYRYRAQAAREEVIRTMMTLIADIDYSNFKQRIQAVQGKDRACVYGAVWNDLWQIREASAKHPAAGGVVFDDEDRILLCRPRNEFDGYAWTFPKGGIAHGESAEVAAIREVREETGYNAAIMTSLPGLHCGGYSYTRYFLMKVQGRKGKIDGEMEAVRWVTVAQAESMLRQTANPAGRTRDLAILQSALECHDLKKVDAGKSASYCETMVLSR